MNVNRIYNEDLFAGIDKINDYSVDLIIADPPYGLGKDYGNDSDKIDTEKYQQWSESWLALVLPKLKRTGSLYIFLTWRFSPEVFCFLKKKMIMINEIVWDRKVPSMGGSTRRFSSVHDTIGFFAKTKDYYFNIDSVRVPYDAETKKARSRSIFVGQKWLEIGYNPKDVWSISRLHRIHSERVDHPTQKPLELIDRMILASCPQKGLVFDPFMGSGTTAVSAKRNGRDYIGFELNPTYCQIADQRLAMSHNIKLDLSFDDTSNDSVKYELADTF